MLYLGQTRRTEQIHTKSTQLIIQNQNYTAMATNLETTCNFLLHTIRTSGLNFSCQETPFSIYVTLRKSFIQSRFTQTSESKSAHEHLSNESELTKVKDNFEKLFATHKNLEEAYVKTKNDFEDAIEECQSNYKIIENLRSLNEEKSVRIVNLDSEIKNLKDNKKSLEIKNENVLKENKSIKKETTELRNEIKSTSKELKSLKKENRDISHDFEKKIEALESKNRSLVEFKATKAAEDKSEKVKIKTINKKLKTIEEKEARLNIDKIKLENEAKKMKVVTEVKVCQTDNHPEIPYEITTPLPPIFSSQLCYATPPIHFLSRSLPRLDKICWSEPEDYMVDEAEEFLNFQYDQQIKQFYQDAKQQAQDQRVTNLVDKTEQKLIPIVEHSDRDRNDNLIH